MDLPNTEASPVEAVRAALRFAAYDERGIWGVGETAEQARAEAEGFYRDRLEASDPALAQTLQGLEVAPISAELLDDVVQFGAGYAHFRLEAGRLELSDKPFGGDEDGDG